MDSKTSDAPAQVPAVPRVWASTFSMIGTDKEMVLLVGSTAVAVDSKGEPQGASVPAIQISMPIPAAKELAALLSQGVLNYEKVFGEVSSEFLSAQKAK